MSEQQSSADSADTEALGYAQRLATILWEKHWKTDAPEWRPLPELIGVLTQIDNLAAGLVRAEPQTASTLTRDGIARIIEQHVPHDEAVGMANAILALQHSQAGSAK